MDELERISLHVAEYIKGRLYFATLPAPPRLISNIHFFSVDSELLYESFYSDFGPLNLAVLYRYCSKLNKKLKRVLAKEKIVHYTLANPKERVNAAFLIGSYAILYLKKTPIEAYQPLVGNNSPLFIPFRDASFSQCTYNLTLSDTLHAVSKALENNFLDFDNFDVDEYDHYEKVENGDLNWIVPNKFLAFCGPHAKSKSENGYPLHSPESYIAYFRKHNVTTIVRLNKKVYDAYRFVRHGFNHKDLFFVDGSTPSDKIMQEFIEISENAKGAIAVHCKAGLGRTGTLIACYIMKHHHFTAAEAIAWVRICRPGSIIGHQQHWLEEKQGLLFNQGNLFRAEKANRKNNNYTPTRFVTRSSRKKDNDLSHILYKVDQIRLDERPKTNDGNTRSRREKSLQNNSYLVNNDNNNNGPETEDSVTQGDKLNRIKAMRRQPRSHTTGGLSLDNLKPHPRSSSQPFKPLMPSAAAYHSTYISPLKPLRSTGSPNSPLDNSVMSPIRRPSKQQFTPCSSASKRRTWRHLISSPVNSASHHPSPSKWDINTFLSSKHSSDFSAPSTSSVTNTAPLPSTNGNGAPSTAPSSFPPPLPDSSNEEVRHHSAPQLVRAEKNENKRSVLR